MSFTAAAEELAITQTAVSLHVRSLEAKLGCKLFNRVARKLSLTEVGQAYAASVRRALDEIELSTTSLFGIDQKLALTVRVPISTAGLFLAHRLPAFLARNPQISVRLLSNIWAESAGRENVDVEIRLGSGHWEDAPSRCISQERIVPIVASSQIGEGTDIADWQDRPVVQILGLQDLCQKYLATLGLDLSNRSDVHSVDTTLAAVDLVAAGCGFAVVLERFATTAIDIGRPIAIAGPPLPIDQAHYLIAAPQGAGARASRVLFESWLEEVFVTWK